MRLNFGMNTSPTSRTLEDLRKAWYVADSSGFDWVCISDHFYGPHSNDRGQPCFEATSVLTALAAQTQNVGVVAQVFCMGYRNPAMLVKSAITIDHVSDGRLVLGLGAGWYEPEYKALGIPFPPAPTRMEMLEEGVQIVRSMLTQEETTFIGKHYRVEGALCYPRPVQEKLRIWIGGAGERRALGIVARYADGWSAPTVSAEEYRHKVGVLDQWCEKEGRDPAEIEKSANLRFYMGTNPSVAHKKRKAITEERPNWIQTGGILFGTPEEAVGIIGEYVNAGAQGLNIDFRAPFDWEALQVFIEEVMPVFA